MKEIVRREWDRLLIHLLFIGFGIRSLSKPLRTVTEVTPAWANVMLSIEFIIAGVMLAVGTLWQFRVIQRAGFIIAFMALFTVTAVVALVTESTLTWLLAAFAFEGIVGLRRLRQRSAEQMLKEVKYTLGEIERERKQ